MRTKTLVLTAGLGVAFIATSMAQAVYSVNAVGYVNTTLLPGFNLIANPLDAGAGNNTISKLFPNMPNDAIVYKYDPVGATFLLINNQFGVWDPAADTTTLAPGEGAFFRNLGTTSINVTFVGEVVQGTGITVALPKGFGIVSSKVPIAGKISTDLKYPAVENDIVYQYNNATGYKITSYSFGAWGAGGPNDEPVIGVGEAFWSRKDAAASWTRDFSVNP